MKPIASRKEGWIINPLLIESIGDGKAISIIYENQRSTWKMLPDGMTFSQFIDLYNACPNSIFVID